MKMLVTIVLAILTMIFGSSAAYVMTHEGDGEYAFGLTILTVLTGVFMGLSGFSC